MVAKGALLVEPLFESTPFGATNHVAAEADWKNKTPANKMPPRWQAAAMNNKNDMGNG